MYENIEIVLDFLFLEQLDSSRERLGAAQVHWTTSQQITLTENIIIINYGKQNPDLSSPTLGAPLQRPAELEIGKMSNSA